MVINFRLTARGREQLLSFFPQSVGQKKVWDKTWRIALIKDSRKLRVILRSLGFRKLARGVYITPLPISVQIKDLLLSGKFSAKIAVIESRRLVLGDNQQLAKQIWPLTEVQQGYQKLIRDGQTLLRMTKDQRQLSDEVKKQFSLILNRYFSLLEQDPGLPRKLLLDDWPALEAQKLLLRLTFCFRTNPQRN
jgi:DNA-binding transcriptional regulator PaaX